MPSSPKAALNEDQHQVLPDDRVQLLHAEDNLFAPPLRGKAVRQERIITRTWMHFDMDMFFAAVEIRDNPLMKDKPIAVGD